MDAVAGVEIENNAAVRGKKFGAFAAAVSGVHSEDIEQPDPLGIDVPLVETFAGGVQALASSIASF